VMQLFRDIRRRIHFDSGENETELINEYYLLCNEFKNQLEETMIGCMTEQE